MTEYFPSIQFASGMITNSVPSNTDNRFLYDEDANSSAASTSPGGDFALSHPPSFNTSTIYYPSHQCSVPLFMGPWETYNGSPYTQNHLGQQPMPYSPSMSPDEQTYFQNGDTNIGTQSPTSPGSSPSYNNSFEYVPNVVHYDESSHLKKRNEGSYSSPFSYFNFSGSSKSIDNDFLDKHRSDIKKDEYVLPFNKHHSNCNSIQRQHEKAELKTHYVKKLSRNKGKKKCSNCRTTESPSWRRSICKSSKGDLVCNACGLYEKTAKRKRMIITNDDGSTKVVRKRDPRGFCCAKCGAKDSTHWKKLHDNTVHCEKCVRGRR